MNAHDDSNPMELINRLAATMEAVQSICPACGTPATVMPALGDRHVLGIDHAPGCPDYIDEDSIPAAVVQPRPEWVAGLEALLYNQD